MSTPQSSGGPSASLPPRPNLEQQRKRAKELLKALRARDPSAAKRVRAELPDFAGAADQAIFEAPLALHDAQRIVAREYGFASWPQLKRHIESVAGDAPSDGRPAVDPSHVEAFKQAVIAGDAAGVRELLANHPELKSRIDDPMFELGAPAVVFARHNRDLVDALLDLGADVNARSQFWGRPQGVLDEVDPATAEHYRARGAIEQIGDFIAAVQAGDAGRVRRLLVDRPALRRKIDAPLFSFGGRAVNVARDNRALMDVLLEFGADINARSDWWAGSFGVLDGADAETAQYLISRGAYVDIHAAAHLGMLNRVKQLVAVNPSLVHARGGDGQTPLHVASAPEIVDFLLDHGAEVDARDVDHVSTPAQYATPRQEWKVRRLIERGAGIDIFMAAALGDVMLIERALRDHPEALHARIGRPGYPACPSEAGGTIYIWNLGGGLTPHEVAHKFGRREAYELLMSRTPARLRLIAACSVGDEQTARRLAAQGPDPVEALSPDDHARLCDAVARNDLRAARLMLEVGFAVEARNDEQSTPLHLAALRGNVVMVELLLPHRPPLEVRNVYGSTPLEMCLWGSLNWRDPAGDYPATAERLIAAGSSLPGKDWGSEPVQAVLRRHRRK